MIQALDGDRLVGLLAVEVLVIRDPVGGLDVALDLVVELEVVAVGVLEAVRAADAEIAGLLPAVAQAGGLDQRDATLERLRAPGAKAAVPQAGLRSFSQLQRPDLIVVPAAQVDRLALLVPPRRPAGRRGRRTSRRL